ncbi:MAG: PEP-CTERM sorting domain-containing protein [Planctomycetes bacterium]|nr:PEP-CTERM sorting domain-containing protein [Planctomycetota bacterium]
MFTKYKKIIGMIFLAVMSCLALPNLTEAEIITVEVTGMVESIDYSGGLAFDNSITNGTSISGSYTYDTAAPDQDSNADDGKYEMINAYVEIGNYTFLHKPDSTQGLNFYTDRDSDRYQVWSEDAEFTGTFYRDGTPLAFDDYTWEQANLYPTLLQGTYDDFVTDDTLPQTVAWTDLEIWKRRYFGLQFRIEEPIEDGYIWYQMAVHGNLTSMTIIPEPATVLLSGLGGLVLLGKHKKK